MFKDATSEQAPDTPAPAAEAGASAPEAAGEEEQEEEGERVETIHEKRKKIVAEVLTTEQYYVKCIDVMVHVRAVLLLRE